MNFWSNGGGSRVLIFESQGRVMLLDTENISFAKFLMHFQPFKGPKFQNVPGEHAPGPP